MEMTAVILGLGAFRFISLISSQNNISSSLKKKEEKIKTPYTFFLVSLI